MPPLTLALALTVAMGLSACSDDDSSGPSGAPAAPSVPSEPTAGAPSGTSSTSGAAEAGRTVVATNLDVPWGLAFLPDGSALVTQRDKGDVYRVRIGAAPVKVGSVAGVNADGEAGLLGIAVSPEFATDRRVFVYFTSDSDNRVARMTLDGNTLTQDKVVLEGIPKGAIHDGGRIAFGPDKRLYVGTGDGGDRSRSQDRESLGGKILRIDQEGKAPSDNPVAGSPVWTWGHRNVQGFAWDAAGRMFATEFGQNTWDELNHIRKGQNYGWPEVEGQGDNPAYVNPLTQWTTDQASPSGMAIGTDGAAYVAALGGRALWQVPLTGATAGTPKKLLDAELGRLRTVERAADGRLWIVTSNTFRGSPNDGDDQIIAIPTDALT